MRKKILRNPSFNLITKITLIIVFLALILSFLYLIVSPMLQSNHKDIVFGDNLPVTNPKNITVVIDLTDLDDGNVSATLSAILIPASTQAIKNSFCIRSIGFHILVLNNYKARNYLYDYFEPSRLELAPYLQQPYYLIPSNVPYQKLPPLGQFGFANDICATTVPRVIEYNEIKDSLVNLMDPSIVINTKISDFYYPFDKRKLVLYVSIQTDSGFVIPDVVGEVFSPDWKVNLPITTTYSENFPPTTKIEVEYLRPTFVRYLVITLLLLLFSLIVASVFIKDNSSYVGVLLGALLGLNGLRPILKPIELSGNTIIDLLFMSFYILLGVSFFAHFIIFTLWDFTGKTKVVNPKKTSKNRKK